MDRVLAGRYQLIKPLGTGGMSVVWLAHDDVLDRHVAVKLLFAGVGRLRDEAKAAAGLSHPNITTVFDYGEADGEPFVVMELVDGRPLSARIREGKVPWRQAAEICAEVAGALNAAHAKGLVHRDVTPSNIMLTATGVKVVDFGIATTAGARNDGPVIGTRPYLAPERLAGEPGGTAADIYALGVVLHEALAGELPPPGPSTPLDGVPAEMATIVAECLADDPAHRPDAAWLARRLARLSGVPARAVDPRHHHVPPDRAAPRPVTRVLPPEPERRKEKRIGWFWVAASIVSAVIAGILAGMTITHGNGAPAAAHGKPGQSPPSINGSCSVRYRVQGVWGSGATISIVVTNTGKAPLHGWTLRFPLAGGLTVAGGWNGTWTQQGDTVTVVAAAHNAEVAAGGSVSDVGTNLAGQSADRIPRQFTLNGVSCDAA